MSTPYELVGRSAQKQRTRQALITAARGLVESGVTPTIDAAAAAASISRTTAYRYFSSQRALLLAAHPEMSASSLLPDEAPTDVAERLDLVVQAFTALIVDTETQQRTMLRLSLENDPVDRGSLPLRQGRAIAWIGEALNDLHGQLSDNEFHRLVLSIRATIGIEALVWLIDIAGLTRSEASDLMRESAQALLHQATGRTHGSPPT